MAHIVQAETIKTNDGDEKYSVTLDVTETRISCYVCITWPDAAVGLKL